MEYYARLKMLENLRQRLNEVSEKLSGLEKRYADAVASGRPFAGHDEWYKLSLEKQVLERKIGEIERELPKIVEADLSLLKETIDTIKSRRKQLVAFFKRVASWGEKLKSLKEEANRLHQEWEQIGGIFNAVAGVIERAKLGKSPLGFAPTWPWHLDLPSFDFGVNMANGAILWLDEVLEALEKKKAELESERMKLSQRGRKR